MPPKDTPVTQAECVERHQLSQKMLAEVHAALCGSIDGKIVGLRSLIEKQGGQLSHLTIAVDSLEEKVEGQDTTIIKLNSEVVLMRSSMVDTVKLDIRTLRLEAAEKRRTRFGNRIWAVFLPLISGALGAAGTLFWDLIHKSK